MLARRMGRKSGSTVAGGDGCTAGWGKKNKCSVESHLGKEDVKAIKCCGWRRVCGGLRGGKKQLFGRIAFGRGRYKGDQVFRMEKGLRRIAGGEKQMFGRIAFGQGRCNGDQVLQMEMGVR